MNLRKMKKLSKRAVPLLEALGHGKQIFLSVKDEGDLKTIINEKKHWNRCPARNVELAEVVQGFGYRPKCREQRTHKFIIVYPPSAPLKGTPMIGWDEGFCAHEWHEETCWEFLCSIVFWHFVDEKVRFDSVELVATRDFSKPHQVLAAAREMIAERESAA